jgi:hypothetical protein
MICANFKKIVAKFKLVLMVKEYFAVAFLKKKKK